MAILDFFKKNNADQTPPEPVSDGQASSINTTSPPQTDSGQVTVQSQTSVSSPQPYSGIGHPPGGGKPYSGIGMPPSQPTITSVDMNKSIKPVSNLADQISPAKQSDQPGTQNKPTGKQAQLDLMTHLTQRSNRIFVFAQQKATELKADLVDSEHILHGLLSDPEIYKFLTDQKILPQIIEQELEKIYKKGVFQGVPKPSPRVKRILDQALVTARKMGYEFISPEHILLSLFDEGEGAGARILAKLGLKKEQLNKKITGKKDGLVGKEDDKGKATGMLEQYTVDLTAKAAQGLLDPVVERSDVIERAIHILSRRTKNNPALIGEAGVGKTAIVEGLAQKIAAKQVPDPLLNKKILQLDLMSIIAGASHRGEFENRMKHIIEEIVAAQGKIILFIDEIHNLVGAGAGGEGSLDASNFLKPSLARGELQVIGATTITEYRRYIEKDPALERRFQPIIVQEPEEEQAIKMVKALRDKYEAFHRVKIPDDAIDAAVTLSKRYIGDRFLPDKAVDLIDEAGAAVRLPLISLPEEIRSLEERLTQLKQEQKEAANTGNKVKTNILQPKIQDLEATLQAKKDEYQQKKSQTTTVVTPSIIKDIVSRWTNIPISKITESEIEKLKKLEDIMHERLINQDVAVSAVAEAVRRGRAGLKSSSRPIGGFVFMGPTGVGKTELAKTLAEVLFGQEEAMIRFDMTEYMEKHEVAKLLGAPPGYVGYEEGGKLTEVVRRKPYSVVLLDEVEKAHPDIFNILLQILDDGRLTDNKGHVISFKNTVVICTSNIGTKTIQDEILASGKEEIEEPDVLTTFVFSPRGRQIITIMGKVFEREQTEGAWGNKMLIDYFSGQKIENPAPKNQDVRIETANQTPSQQFPGKEFDTHAISPKGVEIISYNDRLFIRTSTTAKTWEDKSLIDYFKDNVVINALPDAPEQQLPTARLKTHAFSPDESEIVTVKDRLWKRKADDTNWQTATLKDYFEGQTIQGHDQQKSTVDKPKPISATKNQETTNDKTKEIQTAFPVNYWDIHTFAPDGTEYIILGDTTWIRKPSTTTWTVQTLNEFFGSNFPLDKELDEKKKIEEELEKNQYERIKNKVMAELRNFLRPELINRFDEIIIFEPLKYHHMLKIVDLQLISVKKLLEDQGIGFSWTKPASKEILRQGFDPIYGARPLRRTIQKLIENPISNLIIEQKVTDGNIILVDFDGESFVFNIEKVELMPESQLTSKAQRTFLCQECGTRFVTEVTKDATTICSSCASVQVEEVVEQKKDDSEKKIANENNNSLVNNYNGASGNEKKDDLGNIKEKLISNGTNTQLIKPMLQNTAPQQPLAS